MDYGQPMQPSSSTNQEPDFFTSGAGTNSEDENTFEAENNLDLTNTQSHWGASPERNPRNIGNSAITSSSEATPVSRPEIPQFPEAPRTTSESLNTTPELGQIVPTMPPGYTYEPPSQDTAPDAIPEFDESALKTADRLDSRAVKIVDNAIAKLNQDGNIADFYNTARGMMETHLDNSYNRKLAA